MGDLLSFGSMPHPSLLNNSAAGFGNPGPMDVEHIYKRTKYMSVLVS